MSFMVVDGTNAFSIIGENCWSLSQLIDAVVFIMGNGINSNSYIIVFGNDCCTP